MSERHAVTDAITGKHEIVELYTHDEFMIRKGARLEKIIAEAERLKTVDVSVLSPMETIRHAADYIRLLAEWNAVRGAAGPMVVEAGKNENGIR